IRIQSMEVRSLGDFDGAFATVLREGAHGLITAHAGSAAERYDQPIGPRWLRDLRRPLIEISGEALFRRIGEHDDFVTGKILQAHGDCSSKAFRPLAIECLGKFLRLFPTDVLPERRDIRAPCIPERNCKQGKLQHTKSDVNERQSRRRKAEKPAHVSSILNRKYDCSTESHIAKPTCPPEGLHQPFTTLMATEPNKEQRTVRGS